MTDDLTLADAVEGGDRQEILEVLARYLASSFTAAKTENQAALAKQLHAVVDALAEIPDVTEVDDLDELASRRPDPGTEATVPKRTGRGRK